MSHDITNSMWVTLFIYLPGSLINFVASYDQQIVSSDTGLFVCQSLAVSWLMSDPMTNRQWVTLVYFPARLINHFSFYDQQHVSDTGLILCQTVSSIMSHPMTNSMWVTMAYVFARQFNHVSSYGQQGVSDTFLWQAVSSIMFHPMTNREWVTLVYFFTRQAYQSHLILWLTGCEWHWFISLPGHQSCFILWPTGSEWHLFTSLPGCLINDVSSYDWQNVGDTVLFLCQVLSSISLPTINREWVTLVYFFAR